jgi:hypothetical protein
MKGGYIPGAGCECSARCGCECGCDVDWTPREVYELREQRDRLAEALREIADCDFVITLPDRMDAVRAIAREALGDIKWHKL